MKKLAFLAAVLVLVGLPGLAAANVITYTDSIASQATDWSHALVFPKFSSALGTLTQIELKLDTGAVGTTGMDTKFDVSAFTTTDGHAQTNLIIGVSDPLSLIQVAINKTFPADGFPVPGYHFHIDGSGSTSSGTYVTGGYSDTFYNASAILDEFTGSGNINLGAGTYTSTTATWTGGTPSVTQTTHAALTGAITYYYDAPPVPVPPSLLLLGSGLLGLLALRRRKA